MSKVSSWSTTAASNNSASPDGWPEGMAPSGVNDSARENMAALAAWYSDSDGTLVTTGTSNAYVLTTNIVHLALADQPLLVFRTDRANSGAATLNVDSLGAKAIRSIGSALVANDILADKVVVCAYNATDDAYDLLSPIALQNDPSEITNVTTDRLIGRDTAGTGAAEQLTVGGGVEFTGSAGIQRSALTGDVTASAGSNTTVVADIPAGLVTNAMRADVADTRIQGRAVGAGTGVPTDLTAAQVMTIVQAAPDGAGSGLDADLLDGSHAAAFAPVSHSTPAASTVVQGHTQHATGTEVRTGTAPNRSVSPTGLNAFVYAMKVTGVGNASPTIVSASGGASGFTVSDGDQTGEMTVTYDFTLGDADDMICSATADHTSDPGSDAIKVIIESVTTTTTNIQVFGTGDTTEDGHTVHFIWVRVGT